MNSKWILSQRNALYILNELLHCKKFQRQNFPKFSIINFGCRFYFFAYFWKWPLQMSRFSSSFEAQFWRGWGSTVVLLRNDEESLNLKGGVLTLYNDSLQWLIGLMAFKMRISNDYYYCIPSLRLFFPTKLSFKLSNATFERKNCFSCKLPSFSKITK